MVIWRCLYMYILHVGCTECACSCMIPTLKYGHLEVESQNCSFIVHRCIFYEIRLHVQLKDRNGKMILEKSVLISEDKGKDFKSLPIYELINEQQSAEEKNGPPDDESYSISIQPQCTICEGSCDYFDDIVLPPPTKTYAQEQHQQMDKPLLTEPLIVILTLLGILAITVIIFVFICLGKRSNRGDDERPSRFHRNRNGREIESVLVDVNFR